MIEGNKSRALRLGAVPRALRMRLNEVVDLGYWLDDGHVCVVQSPLRMAVDGGIPRSRSVET